MRSSSHKSITPLRRSLIAACLMAGFVVYVSLQPWGQKLENLVARSFEFKVRRWLKKDPAIDPRLQIYVVEDSTVQYLRKEGLSLNDWVSIITGFKDQKPRAVLVDKVFGIPNEKEPANFFQTKLKELPFPVIVGGFVASSPIKNRPLLTTNQLMEKITAGTSKTVKSVDELDAFSIEVGYPYGPAEDVRGAFKYVGHIMYFGDFFFKPLVRISTYQGIFGAPLFTAKDISIERGGLLVDGAFVPTDRMGRTLINFVSPSLFYDRTEPMSLLFEAVKNKKPFPKILEDSVIVLLPNQYSGNTDYKETPFGSFPGGYVISSFVNSVLTGKWLKVLPGGWAAPLVFGPLAALILTFVGGYSFWLLVLSSITGFILLGLSSFVYWSLALPWFFSSVSLLLSATLVFAMNAREILRRRTEGVAGTVSPLEVRYDEKTGEPTRLGRYHVTERIGRGGMGEVYRATVFGAGGFEKEVALKRMAPEYWTNKSVVQAFLDEAKLTSILNHRNIVQVFEFLRLEDSYLLVMEYVQGISVRNMLTKVQSIKSSVPKELAAYIIKDVCQALEYAHSKKEPHTGKSLKLVHRDISPQNILLSDEGNVKVIDFGIAKGTCNTDHTQTGMVKGNTNYMSPEQAAGKPVDRRSDLFSATLVLYELLTGHRVFGEEGDSKIKGIISAKDWDTRAIDFTKLDLPESLVKVLRLGLEREPENRYQKAEDMHRDLSQYLAECRFGAGRKVLSEFLLWLSTAEKAQSLEGSIHASEKTGLDFKVSEKKTGTHG